MYDTLIIDDGEIMSAFSTTIETGRKTGISSNPIQLTSKDLKADVGVQVVAADTNNDTVWIGSRNSITIDLSDITDGFPIEPGFGMLVPVRSILDIFVVSPSGAQTQKVWWIVL